jgi:hypothetical protein
MIGLERLLRHQASLARAIVGMLLSLEGLWFILSLDLKAPFWTFAFCDARVFVRAANALAIGRNPYERLFGSHPDLNQMPFVQPPQVVWMLELVAEHPIILGLFEYVMVGAFLLGIALATLALSRLFLGQTPSHVLLTFGLFMTLIVGSGTMTMVTGNVGGFLAGAILATLIPALRRGRWLWFHVIVLIATLFKPFYAAFWLIPVFADGFDRRRLWLAVAGVVSSVAISAAAFAAEPELTRSWLDNLASRQRVGDVGCCVYALGRWATSSDVAGVALHFVYALGIGAMILWGRARGRLRHAALVIAAFALNPRMNAYDYAFTAAPTYFIFCAYIRSRAADYAFTLTLLLPLLVAMLSSLTFLNSRNGANAVVLLTLTGALVAAAAWPGSSTIDTDEPSAPKPPELERTVE